MSTITERVETLRQKLIKQSEDPIDMGDYKEQFREYQSIQNETLKLLTELALKVES